MTPGLKIKVECIEGLECVPTEDILGSPGICSEIVITSSEPETTAEPNTAEQKTGELGTLCSVTGCGTYFPDLECNCHSACMSFENCCSDYISTCTATTTTKLTTFSGNTDKPTVYRTLPKPNPITTTIRSTSATTTHTSTTINNLSQRGPTSVGVQEIEWSTFEMFEEKVLPPETPLMFHFCCLGQFNALYMFSDSRSDKKAFDECDFSRGTQIQADELKPVGSNLFVAATAAPREEGRSAYFLSGVSFSDGSIQCSADGKRGRLTVRAQALTTTPSTTIIQPTTSSTETFITSTTPEPTTTLSEVLTTKIKLRPQECNRCPAGECDPHTNLNFGSQECFFFSDGYHCIVPLKELVPLKYLTSHFEYENLHYYLVADENIACSGEGQSPPTPSPLPTLAPPKCNRCPVGICDAGRNPTLNGNTECFFFSDGYHCAVPERDFIPKEYTDSYFKHLDEIYYKVADINMTCNGEKPTTTPTLRPQICNRCPVGNCDVGENPKLHGTNDCFFFQERVVDGYHCELEPGQSIPFEWESTAFRYEGVTYYMVTDIGAECIFTTSTTTTTTSTTTSTTTTTTTAAPTTTVPLATCKSRCGSGDGVLIPGGGVCYCEFFCEEAGDCCEDYSKYCSLSTAPSTTLPSVASSTTAIITVPSRTTNPSFNEVDQCLGKKTVVSGEKCYCGNAAYGCYWIDGSAGGATKCKNSLVLMPSQATGHSNLHVCVPEEVCMTQYPGTTIQGTGNFGRICLIPTTTTTVTSTIKTTTSSTSTHSEGPSQCIGKDLWKNGVIIAGGAGGDGLGNRDNGCWCGPDCYSCLYDPQIPFDPKTDGSYGFKVRVLECKGCKNGLTFMNGKCITQNDCLAIPGATVNGTGRTFGATCDRITECDGKLNNFGEACNCRYNDLPITSCHTCTVNGVGDTISSSRCTKCRDKQYLLDGVCVTFDECIAASGHPTGAGRWGRVCSITQPWNTCKGNKADNGASCWCSGSFGKPDCHACTASVDPIPGIGPSGPEKIVCTVCKNRKLLFDGRCLDDEACSAVGGVPNKKVGNFGRQCKMLP